MPPAPPAPDAPDESAEFLDLVHGVLHAVRRETAARGEHEGVTPGQLRFLRLLDRAGEPRRPGELAAALDLAPRSVTSKVDDAQAEGLVERLPDPSDRRATLVVLTPAGRGLLARVAERRHVGAQERLARLDDTERATLLALLRRVAAPDPPTCP